MKVVGFTVALALTVVMQKVTAAPVNSCGAVLAEGLKITGTLDCDTVRNVAKCTMNITGLTDPAVVTSAQIAAFKKTTDNWSLGFGIAPCDVIDYNDIVQELHEEKIQAQTPGGQIPTVIPSYTQQQLQTCINPLRSIASIECDNVGTAVKCILQAAGFADPKVATDENIDAIKKKIFTAFEVMELSCDFYYHGIVKELQAGGTR